MRRQSVRHEVELSVWWDEGDSAVVLEASEPHAPVEQRCQNQNTREPPTGQDTTQRHMLGSSVTLHLVGYYYERQHVIWQFLLLLMISLSHEVIARI